MLLVDAYNLNFPRLSSCLIYTCLRMHTHISELNFQLNLSITRILTYIYIQNHIRVWGWYLTRWQFESLGLLTFFFETCMFCYKNKDSFLLSFFYLFAITWANNHLETILYTCGILQSEFDLKFANRFVI